MALHFLTPGRMRVPTFLFEPGAWTLRRMDIPTAVAVLERPDGGVVLVDCGLSEAELRSPRRELGLLDSVATPVLGGAECSVRNQLSRLGLSADRVTHVVATHLHLDHIGAFVDFPNAEVVAPAAEFASGRARGRLGGYIHVESILRSGRARAVTFGPPSHGFPRALDLFGDGSVVLLDARGHTAGSVAVLVTDGQGPDAQSVLMAGDLAYSGAEFRLARASLLMKVIGWDLERARATWGAVAAFEADYPDIPVLLSHDEAEFGRVCEKHG